MDFTTFVVLSMLVTFACIVLERVWWNFQHRRVSSGGARLPKGSFGWPFIGETLSFANSDPLEFAGPRVRKYGPVFKTHLAGARSVIVTTPDMAKFIYSRNDLFKADYPSNIANLIGKNSLSSCEPHRHSFLKRAVQRSLYPDSLRSEIGRMERFVLDEINSWVGKSVQTAAELKELTLNITVFFVFGLADIRGSAAAQVLVDTYEALTKAFYAAPINLPGFTWHRALENRKKGCEYLRTLIAKSRKKSKEGKRCGSVLRALVDAQDEEGKMSSDDEIIDVLIGTLFGGHDTTASLLTWVIKFLSEHPKILESIVMEQDEIVKSKPPGEPLTWEDIKKMPHTLQVIQETLRYPTILQFTARSATQDVEYNGCLIPKGWRVYVMTTCIHLDAENHPEPATFDPSRFKATLKNGTYLPFGRGSHMCPGNELAKLVTCVFVHHLTTKFRWDSLLPGTGTAFKPFPSPMGGYPIKIYRRHES